MGQECITVQAISTDFTVTLLVGDFSKGKLLLAVAAQGYGQVLG